MPFRRAPLVENCVAGSVGRNLTVESADVPWQLPLAVRSPTNSGDRQAAACAAAGARSAPATSAHARIRSFQMTITSPVWLNLYPFSGPALRHGTVTACRGRHRVGGAWP